MSNAYLKLNFDSEEPPTLLFQGWMTYLGMGSKKALSPGQGAIEKRPSISGNSNNEDAKKLAAAALSAVKDAAALGTSGRGKVEVHLFS